MGKEEKKKRVFDKDEQQKEYAIQRRKDYQYLSGSRVLSNKVIAANWTVSIVSAEGFNSVEEAEKRVQEIWGSFASNMFRSLRLILKNHRREDK